MTDSSDDDRLREGGEANDDVEVAEQNSSSSSGTTSGTSNSLDFAEELHRQYEAQNLSELQQEREQIQDDQRIAESAATDQSITRTALRSGHISNQPAAKRRRLLSKQTPSSVEAAGNLQNFTQAWDEYISGYVVSDYARQLITSVLVNTMAKGREDEPEEDVEADGSDIDDEITPLVMKGLDFRNLFQRLSAYDTQGDQDGQAVDKRKVGKFSHDVALRQVQDLWGAAQRVQDFDQVVPEVNPMKHAASKDHCAAVSTPQLEEDDGTRPYSGKTLPQASLFCHKNTHRLDSWLCALQQRSCGPNVEQFEFLQALGRRLCTETRNEADDSLRETEEEPMFDLVHGIPGSGKSALISWVREMFEEVMQWKHGVQFVTLESLWMLVPKLTLSVVQSSKQ